MKEYKSLAEVLSSSNEKEEIYQSETLKRKYRANNGKYTKIPHMFDFIHLVKGWEDIVGKMLSENTIPLRIKNQQLYILTKHSIFSQELGFMAPLIIEKIDKMFPSFNGKIKKIRFSHGKFSSEEFNMMKANTQKKEVQEKEKPHPFDPKYRMRKIQVEKMFEDIDDGEIKDLLISITLQN